MTKEDFEYLYSMLPPGRFFVRRNVPDTNSCHFHVGDVILVNSHLSHERYFMSGTLNRVGFYPLVFISDVEPILQGNRGKAIKKYLERKKDDTGRI